MARDIFPRFDLAILVKADLATRKARLALRSVPSRIDSRSIESHQRFLAAYRLVFKRHRRRIVIDTSHVEIEDAVDVALQHIIDTAGYRHVLPRERGSEVLVSTEVSGPSAHSDALISSTFEKPWFP
jgi:cytidylate kinase